MDVTTARCCPLCGKHAGTLLRRMNLTDFDGGSPFSCFSLIACSCGMVYNDLTCSAEAIEKFYTGNKLYPSTMGVGSGGITPLDLERYTAVLHMVSPLFPGGKHAKIVDVGCAKGGFLRFLKASGYTNLCAVDLNSTMIRALYEDEKIEGNIGEATALPLENNSVAVLNYSNILEHIFDLHGALAETNRVLNTRGVVVVEVPDARRYGAFRIADYYWLSQSEHINHFDKQTLIALFSQHGFGSILLEETTMQLGQTAPMPIIRGVFTRLELEEKYAPEVKKAPATAMEMYVHQEELSLQEHRAMVDPLRRQGRPVYIWGRGLELQCLYRGAGLQECAIRAIIDNNPVKQGITVDGLQVVADSVLKAADANSTVVITAALHKTHMIEYLLQMHYPGSVVVLV